MKVEWSSQKGRLRKSNRDAVAIAYKGDFLVVVIADAAEKLTCDAGFEGKGLACYWAENCIKAILNVPEALTNVQCLINLLREQHKFLKHHYLHDIASYGILVLNTAAFTGNWYFVGDCLLGSINRQGQAQWLHKPHRVSECIHLEHSKGRNNILTKSLKARRFALPDILCLSSVKTSTALLLATDGYWCELLQQNAEIELLEDDCSVLKIERGPRQLLSKTDAPNLFYFSNFL